ncbi:MAG: NifU family protein [Actinobacteria bacterium]|nr:NifU family protein [Actinomycetota bacterium]
MRALVEATIEVIRPVLQADGGDIVLRDVDPDTGVVSVTLLGACGNCPASTQTLKAGIERIMKDRVVGLTEVVNVPGSDAAGADAAGPDAAASGPTDEVVDRR